jgi:hypothetical protein
MERKDFWRSSYGNTSTQCLPNETYEANREGLLRINGLT